jgi:predicted RNA-binding protein with PIN domain
MFIIDGYNLLHAMGILRGKVGPFGLQKARLGLLGLLHATYQERSPQVMVVFDAAHAPAGTSEEEEYKGIRIRWAVKDESADDVIESLIRGASTPTQLTVVTDDRQIQRAARRRRCRVCDCADFLEHAKRYRRERLQKVHPNESRKPDQLSEDESQYWLRQFADLEDHPDMKKLSDPIEWKDIEQ